VSRAAFDRYQTKLNAGVSQPVEHRHRQLDRVGVPFVDLHPAVPAAQSGHPQLDSLPPSGCRRAKDRKREQHVAAAGASHGQRLVILAIEVDQYIRIQHGGVQIDGAVQTCLLLHGEHELERSV
jgi:hypothetical protein